LVGFNLESACWWSAEARPASDTVVEVDADSPRGDLNGHLNSDVFRFDGGLKAWAWGDAGSWSKDERGVGTPDSRIVSGTAKVFR
jgi:hypothetical protein